MLLACRCACIDLTLERGVYCEDGIDILGAKRSFPFQN
jgi:hypothetical protein